LPTVTISASPIATRGFKDNFDNGTISNYFNTDDYKVIFPGLDDLGIVEELKNGEIKLHLFSDEEMGKDFYIGLPQNIKFSKSDTSWMSKTECVLVLENDQ
jgi:hypothetical protein